MLLVVWENEIHPTHELRFVCIGQASNAGTHFCCMCIAMSNRTKKMIETSKHGAQGWHHSAVVGES